MRRVLVLVLVSGLLSAPVPVGGQTTMPTIVLSFDDGAGTPSAVTGVSEEGGGQTVRVVATASAAVTGTAVMVRVLTAMPAADTALNVTDYAISRLQSDVTIAVGQRVGRSAALTVTPVDDDRVEGDETIQFTAQPVSGYQSIAAVNLLIEDDDDVIALSLDKSDVLEWDGDPSDQNDQGEQPVTVTAAFAGTASDLTAAADVTVTVAGGSGSDGATAGVLGPPKTNDFSTDQTNDSFTVSIGAGSLSGSGSFMLRAHADTDAEADGEKVEVSGAVSGFTVESAELTIHDPVVSLGLTDAGNPPAAVSGLDEDGGRQTVGVSASFPAVSPVEVTVTATVAATGRTATAGAGGDYTTTEPETSTITITIPEGAASGSAGSRVYTALSDRVTENNEVISRISGTATGYTVNSVDLVINDADRTIRLYLPPLNIQEGWIGFTWNDTWTDIPRAELGSGDSLESFVASTSSTWTRSPNNYMLLRILPRDGTARQGVGGDFQLNVWSAGRYAYLLAGEVRSTRLTDNQRRGNLWGQTALNSTSGTAVQDTVAEDAKTFDIFFQPASVPAGFTTLDRSYRINDDDSQVTLSVDFDSQTNGVQNTLAEGADESGAVMSAAFKSGTTSSNIAAAREVDSWSVEGEVSPAAGQAGADDFTYYAPASAGTITFAAMSTSTSDTVMLGRLVVVDDTVVEGPETITVKGSSGLLGDGTATGVVTITDNDADIVLSVDKDAVREGQGAEDVTVTARFVGSSSELASATDVTVTVAGADTDGADSNDFSVAGTGVSNNSFTVSIPAGAVSGSKTVQVTAVDDTSTEGAEGEEGLVVSGSAMVGSESVTVTSADMIITDQWIRLSLHEADSGEAALSRIVEGGESQMVRVKATASSAVSSETAVTVTVGASGGTASSDDYTSSAGTVQVTIQSGQTEGSADVTVTPQSDGVVEGPERIRFGGSAPSGWSLVNADLEITEEVTLTLDGGGSVGEEAGNAGAVSVTAGFAGASSSELTADTDVVLSFSAGEHTEAADFTAPASAVTVSIPAGMTSGSAVALSGLTIVQDTIAEGDESVDVGGTTAGFAVEGAELGIVDDDLGVALTADTDIGMNGEQKGLSEGDTPAVQVRAAFTSAASNDLSQPLVVSVTAGEASPVSAAGGGVDFTAPASPAAVSIPVGSQTMGAWTDLAGLAVTDDAVTEGAETFLITGTVPGGVVTPDTLTIAASDDSLEVSVSPGTVVEQAAAHTITVTAGFAGAASSELTAATTINVAAAAGDTDAATLAASCPTTTMDACTDTATFDVSIPAGQVGASGTFTLTARADGDNTEGVETLKVTGTVAGSSVSDEAVLRIADEGIRVELLNPADDSALSSLGEGSGSSSVRVRATAPSSTGSRRVVGLNVTGGTAVVDADGSWGAGEDFRVTGLTAPSGTPAGHALGVEIAANQTSGTADITIVLNDDNVDEDTETILIAGEEAALPVIGAGLDITDNDSPPTVIDLALETPDGDPLTSVREDGGTARVRVRASYQGAAVLPRTVTVPLTVGASSEAASGTDYQAVTGAAVAIPAYQSEGVSSFDLVIGPAENDTDAEGPETVTVSGGTVAGSPSEPAL